MIDRRVDSGAFGIPSEEVGLDVMVTRADEVIHDDPVKWIILSLAHSSR